jgi:glycosyltransferase involved in cell wall biosynthesis
MIVGCSDLCKQGESAKSRIVIVKNYYPIEKDTRLIKLLKMFVEGNFEVTYVGWNRDCTSLARKASRKSYCNEIVMQKVAPYGATSYLFLPFWWLFVIKTLLRNEWDAAHVVNFPSITPVIIASKLKRKPVVYDIEDTTADQLPFQGFLRTLGIIVERAHAKYVTAVVLVDELQNDEFCGIPNENVNVIYDSPPYSRSEGNLVRKAFSIFYAGYLNRQGNLNIESILEAVKDIENVHVTIVGEGNLVDKIKEASSKWPDKIKYLDWLPYETVLELSCSADLLFSLRDPYPLTHKYICGSKFLEAMMCGKPILVNKGTSTAIKVTKAKCGLVLDAHNVQEVRHAILTLMHDKDLRERLATNSEKEYNRKYSWEKMKQKLLNLYADILSDTQGSCKDYALQH